MSKLGAGGMSKKAVKRKQSKLDTLDAMFRASWADEYKLNGVAALISRLRPQYSWVSISAYLEKATNVKVRPETIKRWMVRKGYIV